MHETFARGANAGWVRANFPRPQPIITGAVGCKGVDRSTGALPDARLHLDSLVGVRKRYVRVQRRIDVAGRV
jgi:hypothetical protein